MLRRHAINPLRYLPLARFVPLARPLPRTQRPPLSWPCVRLTLCLSVACWLAACSSPGIRLQDSNSLLVNKFGVLCNPQEAIAFDRRKVTCRSHAGSSPYVTNRTLPALVAADLEEARQAAQSQNSEAIKLLIYIHGGLNRVTESLENNRALKASIINDQEHWHYPKFLVWPSDGLTNYFEHALNVSGGRYSENVLRGLFGGTATLVSDSLQAVVNVPRSWFVQGVNVKDHIRALNEDQLSESLLGISHAWRQARINYCTAVGLEDEPGCEPELTNSLIARKGPTDQPNFYWSSYTGDSLNPFRNPRLIWERVSALSRLTVGSLTHSEIGAASWRNMKRRAFNVTSPTVLFDNRIRDRHSCTNARTGEHCVPGIQYFDELLRQIRNSEDAEHFEITLIGHSMGAFILNSLINTHLDELVENQILKNVVYMAAATTIEETILAIRNLYEAYDSREIDREQWPQVSNLMLNRVAEVSEMMFYGLVPTGSLLVWVDEIYERPTHPAGRTVGAEVNVYAALPYIERQLGPYYTDKLTFKPFDRAPGEKPMQHGEFNDGQFWHPSFWLLETQ